MCIRDRYDEIIRAFSAGRCDAFTTDKSQLASTRTTLENPDKFIILPEDFSKEMCIRDRIGVRTASKAGAPRAVPWTRRV